MSKQGFIKIVETDENGKEKALAGFLGQSLGSSGEAMDALKRMMFFMKINDINNFEDSTLFAFRMLEDLGASGSEDDIDNLQDMYPSENFEYPEYEDEENSLFLDEESINDNYENYKDGSAASINISDKTISFGVITKWTKEEAIDNGCMKRNLYNTNLPLNMDKLSFADFEKLCYFADYDYHDNFYFNDDQSAIYNFKS